MKRDIFLIIFLVATILVVFKIYLNKNEVQVYDFIFAELAVEYLESGDSTYLHKIAETEACTHIFNHAHQFNYAVPKETKLDLVTYLLSPFEEKKALLQSVKQNIQFAKKHIAKADLARKIAMQYLPEGFDFKGKLFFTFGYDLGVAFNSNASLNLAHPHYIQNPTELKYYSIHEIHHAGFIALKNNKMSSLKIKTYKEMAALIEYLTHLEAMGTYAPWALRIEEAAMNSDRDYIALQNETLMQDYEKEYFDIYFHFKNNPDKLITDKDWEKLSILSDKKRLWYRVGAMMCQRIDDAYGRAKLTELIAEDSEVFIKTYLKLKP